MADLFSTPLPDSEDQIVIAEIHQARAFAAAQLRVPRRWNGVLRADVGGSGHPGLQHD